MEEEAAAHAVEALAQEGGQDKQVVVVHPDKVVLERAEDLDEPLAEGHVCADVGAPQRGVEARGRGGAQRQLVVHDRPELLLAEAAVERVLELRAEEDREAAELGLQLRGDLLHARRRWVEAGGQWAGQRAGLALVWNHFSATRRPRRRCPTKNNPTTPTTQRPSTPQRAHLLLRALDLDREAPDVDGLHLLGEALGRLPDERVLVPLEGPARGGVAAREEGEVVGDEDEPAGARRRMDGGGNGG